MSEPTFAELLTKHIRDRGWKISDLAEEMDVPERTIENWKKGPTKPRDVKTVVQLAVLMGLSEDEANILIHSVGHETTVEKLRPRGATSEEWRKLLQVWDPPAPAPLKRDDIPRSPSRPVYRSGRLFKALVILVVLIGCLLYVNPSFTSEDYRVSCDGGAGLYMIPSRIDILKITQIPANTRIFSRFRFRLLEYWDRIEGSSNVPPGFMRHVCGGR